jgi:hypothetical protein
MISPFDVDDAVAETRRSVKELGFKGIFLRPNLVNSRFVCHPAEQMLAAVSLCGGGVLERHPRLRVAFLEGNASRAPFLLWRMDEHYEWLGDVYARELTMEPSRYFKRQCFVSAESGPW